MKITKIIAHRGASKLAPENTLTAFRLAEELGATMFECDVLLSKDEVPVIFHDDDLQYKTNGHGAIRETSFSIIQTLDTGGGESIPTLAQLLEWFKTSTMNMNLELKYEANKASPEPLAHIVCEHLSDPNNANLQERILISSFNLNALHAIRIAFPKIAIGLLIDYPNLKAHGFKEIAEYYNALQAISIHCGASLLTPDNIRAFIAISPNIFAYTVNDAKSAEKLFHQGIKAIFTDNEQLYRHPI